MNLHPTLTAELAARLPAPLPPPEIDPDLLDTEALKVVARLRRHGYAAYLVGGCVRDLILGADPKDWDIATSATPEQIRDVFRNSRLIGRRFRLAHVFFPNGKILEVATFRATPVEQEGEDGDLLVTDDNQFGTAEEDALRRDFTMNALFYDVVEGKVIDFVGGRADLDLKLVRTIGDAEIRLREDPVRGVRAARIAAKLGLSFETATWDAMVRHADELPRCAPARVLEETLKVLRSGASRRAFEHLHASGILRVLVPPVHEELARTGAEGAKRLFARLDALDALVGRESVSDAVMLATVYGFLPLHATPGAPEGPVFDEPEEPTPHQPPSIDTLLVRMSAHARLPRKIADRVRAIAAAQRLFAASHKKKRRRGSSSGFVRTPHFAEALQLFEINVIAGGHHRDVLDKWKERAQAHRDAPQAESDDDAQGDEEAETPAVATPPPPPAPIVAPAAEGTPLADGAAKKKRRRRGGRRHKKAGEATTEEATPGAPDEDAGT